jgi:hypothetical protein
MFFFCDSILSLDLVFSARLPAHSPLSHSLSTEPHHIRRARFTVHSTLRARAARRDGARALPSGDEQCIIFSQLYATCSIDTRIAGEQCCSNAVADFSSPAVRQHATARRRPKQLYVEDEGTGGRGREAGNADN